MQRESYVHGNSGAPLIGKTIGALLDDVSATDGSREALVVTHQKIVARTPRNLVIVPPSPALDAHGHGVRIGRGDERHCRDPGIGGTARRESGRLYVGRGRRRSRAVDGR